MEHSWRARRSKPGRAGRATPRRRNMSDGFGSSSHAVLIGLDGLSIAALNRALNSGNAPHLAKLRARGAFTEDARVTQPSLSLPNWASTLFAVPPAFHGVHLPRLDDDVRPATLAAGGTWPNAFTIAQHAKGNAFTTAAYYSWPPLAQLLPRATLNASVLATCTNCDDCLRVEPTLVADYVSALRTRRFGLSWLYVDALDECGHARGANSRGYLDLVRRVDSWVGQVVDALPPRTTLLVMSDHGRAANGFGHGGYTTEEMAVQWLLVGPSVRQGVRLSSPVSIMDSMATLLHALGITPPVQVYGRVVREAFEPLLQGERAAAAGLTQRRTPLWSLRQNATAAEMRATVDGGAARADSRGKRLAAVLHGWDGHSLLLGVVLGAVSVMLCIRLLRMRHEAQVRLGGARSLSGTRKAGFFREVGGGAASDVHPAAHRLRAAAGTCSPDDEEFSPLVG